MKRTQNMSQGPYCRFCGAPLRENFVDLGMSPLCQTHIAPSQLNDPEPFYPLHAFVCTGCWLVQLEEYVRPEDIFGDYDYFSSFSDSWLDHARRYVDMAAERFNLGRRSLVVEIASNDGYLLRNFVRRDIPVLGIEPAANVARIAEQNGVRTLVEFHGEGTAKTTRERYGQADLIVGNNVLAHVPDINDFIRGLKVLLKPEGVVTMEFPHLVNLMRENQFDTIYHEHFSYLSLYTVERMFAHHGLTIFDVDEIPTHGGSLRIYARHAEAAEPAVADAVQGLLQREMEFGIDSLDTYRRFEDQVKETKRNILQFLIDAKREGKTVIGYGAPGKGNTLLNYCGIRTDFLDYTVDRSPQKQGKYTPGTRIPILDPSVIRETRPDYVLILPWNLRNEISTSHSYIKEWGGRFVVPIPRVEILD